MRGAMHLRGVMLS